MTKRPKSRPADAAKLDLGDYLPYLVNRVGTIIAEQFTAEALAAHDLSIAMWRVLVVLAENGGQRQIDLAGLTSIDVSTLSRLVTRLIRRGFVTRTRSRSSNREVVVALTAKAAATVRELVPVARQLEQTATAGLAAGTIAGVKAALRRMYDNLGADGEPKIAAPARRRRVRKPKASGR